MNLNFQSVNLIRNIVVATLLGVFVLQFAYAQKNIPRLNMRLAGEAVMNEIRSNNDPRTGYYGVSLDAGELVIQKLTGYTPSHVFVVRGDAADQLHKGVLQKKSVTTDGSTVRAPQNTIFLLEENTENAVSLGLAEGRFPSNVVPAVLREGWTARAKIGNRVWNFSVTFKKRPDGKLLAGSMSVIGHPDKESETSKQARSTNGAPPKSVLQNSESIILLAPASGMAFSKQELLWLGDLNSDGQPDLLLKRTWVTGEVDYVMVINPYFNSVYWDPDYPTYYYESPPDSAFMWHKSQAPNTPIKFIDKGHYDFSPKEWRHLLPDADAALPVTLTDRQFTIDNQTFRFVIEHLPRMNSKDSSGDSLVYGRNLLVKVFFRGSSQVIMQTRSMDTNGIQLSIGSINDEVAVFVEESINENNTFYHYWVWDESKGRFRKLHMRHYQPS